jgi:hypothetical protein
MSKASRVDDVRVVHDEDIDRWTCTFSRTDNSIRTYRLRQYSHLRIAEVVRRLSLDPTAKWATFPTFFGWHAWQRRQIKVEYR